MNTIKICFYIIIFILNIFNYDKSLAESIKIVDNSSIYNEYNRKLKIISINPPIEFSAELDKNIYDKYFDREMNSKNILDYDIIYFFNGSKIDDNLLFFEQLRDSYYSVSDGKSMYIKTNISDFGKKYFIVSDVIDIDVKMDCYSKLIVSGLFRMNSPKLKNEICIEK